MSLTYLDVADTIRAVVKYQQRTTYFLELARLNPRDARGWRATAGGSQQLATLLALTSHPAACVSTHEVMRTGKLLEDPWWRFPAGNPIR